MLGSFIEPNSFLKQNLWEQKLPLQRGKSACEFYDNFFCKKEKYIFFLVLKIFSNLCLNLYKEPSNILHFNIYRQDSCEVSMGKFYIPPVKSSTDGHVAS